MNQSKLSGNLYGITHDIDGTPRVSEPHVVKVGVGLLRGKAIHVYIDRQGKWVIQTGYGNETRRTRFETRAEAQREYFQIKSTVPERKYPERLPYFTFSHPAPSGEYEPDFDVIEAHGSLPTEIEVAFIWDEPFEATYQFWTAAELKCEGDGRDAFRIISMAKDAEHSLAEKAKAAGEKYFEINDCCSEYGCPYCKPVDDKPAVCRPLGTLKFQLINSPRLGGTAFYQTTGYRSIRQIFSAIQIFRRVAGPHGHITQKQITMAIMPYRVRHNGRNTTQYSVNLEFRKQNAVEARRAFYNPDIPPQLEEPETLKRLEASTSNAGAITAEFNESPDETASDVDDTVLPEVPEVIPEEIGKEGNDFYRLCRGRGMNDRDIFDRLGQEGYETLSEIPSEALPALVKWAEEWQPRRMQ